MTFWNLNHSLETFQQVPANRCLHCRRSPASCHHARRARVWRSRTRAHTPLVAATTLCCSIRARCSPSRRSPLATPDVVLTYSFTSRLQLSNQVCSPQVFLHWFTAMVNLSWLSCSSASRPSQIGSLGSLL